MKEYGFFSYAVHEALHLSAQEQEIVLECFRKIDYELRHALDQHSKRLMVSNIELFLNYCVRFYDRQFLTRDQQNISVLEKFEHLLDAYFQSDAPQLSGLPSVSLVADKLHLSANYFGDLVKRETGKTAQEYVQLKLIAVAKEKILTPVKRLTRWPMNWGLSTSRASSSSRWALPPMNTAGRSINKHCSPSSATTTRTLLPPGRSPAGSSAFLIW